MKQAWSFSRNVQSTAYTQTLCPQKISIILFTTDEIFIKLRGLIRESTQDTRGVVFALKSMQCPYRKRFILMTSCRTETEAVEWRKLDQI